MISVSIKNGKFLFNKWAKLTIIGKVIVLITWLYIYTISTLRDIETREDPEWYFGLVVVLTSLITHFLHIFITVRTSIISIKQKKLFLFVLSCSLITVYVFLITFRVNDLTNFLLFSWIYYFRLYSYLSSVPWLQGEKFLAAYSVITSTICLGYFVFKGDRSIDKIILIFVLTSLIGAGLATILALI